MNCKKSLKKDYTKITDYYEKLVLLTKKKYFVGPTNEWFIDNYYLLRVYLKSNGENKVKISFYKYLIKVSF